MIACTYTVYHSLTKAFLGEIPFSAPKWVEAVNAAGTFTGTVTVPDDELNVEQLRAALSADNWLIEQYPNGQVGFSGYISNVSWNSVTNVLTVKAIEWRAYPYRIAWAPLTDDPTSNTIQYTAEDQLEIARQITYQVVNATDSIGVPVWDVLHDSTLSGVTRDLLFDGAKFRSWGTWLDAIANRDNGFEWDTHTVVGDTPKVYFDTYYPEQGGASDELVFSYQEGVDGNILAYDDPEQTNDDVIRRQWATAQGPDSATMLYAADEDPDLANDPFLLRFDNVTTYQDVVDVQTLASHARSERYFYSLTQQLFSFTVLMDSPNVWTYGKGDRCTIQVKDRWLDVDQDYVRIVQREFDPESGTVKLTCDLNDFDLPETDPDGDA